MDALTSGSPAVKDLSGPEQLGGIKEGDAAGGESVPTPLSARALAGAAACKPGSGFNAESAAFNEQLQRLRARLQSVVQGVREVAQSLDEPHTLIANVRDQLQSRREGALRNISSNVAATSQLAAISCPLDVTGRQAPRSSSARSSTDDLDLCSCNTAASEPSRSWANAGNSQQARRFVPSMSVKALVAAVERQSRSPGSVAELLPALSSGGAPAERASVESLPSRTSCDMEAASPEGPQRDTHTAPYRGPFADALAAAAVAAGSPTLELSSSPSAGGSPGTPSTAPVTAAEASYGNAGGSSSSSASGLDARFPMFRTASGSYRLRPSNGSALASPTGETAGCEGTPGGSRWGLPGDDATEWSASAAGDRSASFGGVSRAAAVAGALEPDAGELPGSSSGESGLLAASANAAAAAAYLEVHPETLRELWTLRARVRAQEGELAAMVTQLSTKNAQLDQAQTAVLQKDKELAVLTQRLAGVLSRLQAFQAVQHHQQHLQQQLHHHQQLQQQHDGLGPQRLAGHGAAGSGLPSAGPNTPSRPHSSTAPSVHAPSAAASAGSLVEGHPATSSPSPAPSDAAADWAPTVASAKALFTALGLSSVSHATKASSPSPGRTSGALPVRPTSVGSTPVAPGRGDSAAADGGSPLDVSLPPPPCMSTEPEPQQQAASESQDPAAGHQGASQDGAVLGAPAASGHIGSTASAPAASFSPSKAGVPSSNSARPRELLLSPRSSAPAAAAAAAAAAANLVKKDPPAAPLPGRGSSVRPAATGAAGNRRRGLAGLLLQVVPSLACVALLLRDTQVRRGLAWLHRGVVGQPAAAGPRRRVSGGGRRPRFAPAGSESEELEEASMKCHAKWCKMIRPPPQTAFYY
ncbi:hypothetical protein Agub_g15514 [Astrephomene gubernaculifera]|uniref:Uncharacterized protein n=1 Tax=Astrephomene gubernaculifera TaxID=47775 RepID=A0AAD3HU13_9CHLO|nr:hypothetical protein Agub_g15514 [Astrephomene gubernaculifera]